MPELPEVETVRRGLLPYLEGKIIKRITLNRADLRGPIPKDIPTNAKGKRVTALDRHGKTMIWRLDGAPDLAWHLGMSGSFRAFHHGKPDAKAHDHVVVEMEDGGTLVYNDPRRFGALGYARDLPGIDPFEKTYTFAAFEKLFMDRKAPIKAALLDQSLITGIGNIYACEALFETHIHPARSASALKKEELKALFHAVKAVLQRAIASGGSSLRDHVMVNGEAGKFQHEFFVYGRKGKPCQRCESPIELLRQSGRASFLCPSCQPLNG